MRRLARETVFKLIFEYSFLAEKDEDALDLLSLASDLDDDDKEYIGEIYKGVIENFDTLKEKIASYLENYRIERLYRPDLIVLILAAYEIEQETAPSKVIINEAVELAKKYGTEKSGGFVNGVLARLANLK